MSEIIRYERAPGDFGGIADLPEGAAVVLGETGVGDPVFPPEEVGGGMRRVAAVTRAPCPLCGAIVKHYAMDGSDGLGCAECVACRKFVWYRR